MFAHIFTLVIKELEMLLQDRQSRLILIMPLFLQLAVFPFAATLEVKNNTLAVYNEDNGRESMELVQRFSRAEAIKFGSFLQILNANNLRGAASRTPIPVACRDTALIGPPSLCEAPPGLISNVLTCRANF